MVKAMKSTLCYKHRAERPNKLTRNIEKSFHRNGLTCWRPGVNKRGRKPEILGTEKKN